MNSIKAFGETKIQPGNLVAVSVIAINRVMHR